MSDTRTELLELHLQRNAHVQQMIEGARLVTEGGVEGIQEVAQTQPEAILNALNYLVCLIEQMQTESNEALERELAFCDALVKTNPK